MPGEPGAVGVGLDGVGSSLPVELPSVAVAASESPGTVELSAAVNTVANTR